MALKLISVPIKNKPNERKILLAFLKNKIHESSKIKKDPAEQVFTLVFVAILKTIPNSYTV